MATTMLTKQRSCAFLIEPAPAGSTFTPEDFDSETRMMGKAADDFVRNEVLPLLPEIEQAKEGLMRELDRKMGELGFTAAEVPTHYGGLDLPKTTVALIVEKLGPEPATCLTLQAHAGLAILPLVLEGTPAQKTRYLPKLASGEWCGSFCLSETGSGSDALAMRTRAVPTDGGYLLNGEKMWVTNAGFADLFTVFAKLNGEQFTAFLVERTTPGVNLGREEHKIGLHGSSTRRVAFENVFVPAENLLGEVGKAHYIALNTLNLGRYKMAASALGTGKYALEVATRYAKDRQQFGQPIANFGLVRHKLARMATHLFALESMLYRTGHLMQAWFDPIHDLPPDHPELHLRYREAASEYAGECALLKFYGTEVQYLCADEGVQIHGGYGYTEDFPIAKIFRESRVPRIYEGTNEINRLNFTQHVIRQMQRAGLPLLEEARAQASALTAELPTDTRDAQRAGCPVPRSDACGVPAGMGGVWRPPARAASGGRRRDCRDGGLPVRAGEHRRAVAQVAGRARRSGRADGAAVRTRGRVPSPRATGAGAARAGRARCNAEPAPAAHRRHRRCQPPR
jgi:alkylation response protein AidB-like acyl-CoA dehydrogenase